MKLEKPDSRVKKALNRIKRRKKGVTLILVAGVLSILAAMGAGFYTLMLMQQRAAVRNGDYLRAEWMARAGINFAIAQLHKQAYIKTEDPSDAWYPVDYLHGAAKRVSYAQDLSKNGKDDDLDGNKDNVEEKRMPFSLSMGGSAGFESDRFSLQVSDAAGKININAGDNLAVILDNLCRVIGPPLVCADLDYIQPRRWATEGASGYDKNTNDTAENRDLYYETFTDGDGKIRAKLHPDGSGRAMYGDGYAIAGYRARNGRFKTILDIKKALTFVSRPDNHELEQLELEVKFAALKDHITVDSWVDTNTVCTGKFEWVTSDGKIAIDREKSWIPHELKDSYVSIVNNHGSGLLRRIKENGTDWIEVEDGFRAQGLGIPLQPILPGPISSYMIVAKEDALIETVSVDKSVVPSGSIRVPKTDNLGNFVDDPDVDYSQKPLSIHRAPVNINTATDKVLLALFLGLNVQHGSPLAVGTNADKKKYYNDKVTDPVGAKYWYIKDEKQREKRLLTAAGLKRIPLDTGKPAINRPKPWGNDKNFDYLLNGNELSKQDFEYVSGEVTEAHELAYRVIIARTFDEKEQYIDTKTGKPTSYVADETYKRGPFLSWDDFYFRVIRPWDDHRIDKLNQLSVAPLIMANFNPNTDMLKFNPNIEWIDRWGRNFTEMEPVMMFTDNGSKVADTVKLSARPLFVESNGGSYELGVWPIDAANNRGAYVTRNYRYRMDEMIDKSDINRGTTEFSLDSGGIFEIASTGQVVQQGQVLSEKRLEALVQVYGVWRETTQEQFVKGVISKAADQGLNGSSFGAAQRGSVGRDSVNVNARLALTTVPEALVPLKFQYSKKFGEPNIELIDNGIHDAYARSKNSTVPDVVANMIHPARWDGAIILSTNTLRFDSTGENDTFLASYEGDLDSRTSAGNGREQAKMPGNPKIRAVDTCSVLGLLGDTLMDNDTELPGGVHTYPYPSIGDAMSPLNPKHWEANVSLRMGDIRPEGVFLGGPGVGGNDATLKYMIGDNYENFDINAKEGVAVSMWAKTNWRQDDDRNHDFLSATNPGTGSGSKACYLVKDGRVKYTYTGTNLGAGTVNGGGLRYNDLSFIFEAGGNGADNNYCAFLFGGCTGIPRDDVFNKNTGKYKDLAELESPAYRVQPFRWNYLGFRVSNKAVIKANQDKVPTHYRAGRGPGQYDDAGMVDDVTNRVRPFINTMTNPDTFVGLNPDSDNKRMVGQFWVTCEYGAPPVDSVIGKVGPLTSNGQTGQPLNYDWGSGRHSDHTVFGFNNLNPSQSHNILRHLIEDGTYAVIDEVKISSEADLNPKEDNIKKADRVAIEEHTGRYYTPNDPSKREDCPTFTSQSMYQSLKGFNNKTQKEEEEVTLARVSWTVFTPRFMAENVSQKYSRTDNVSTQPYGLGKSKQKASFRGPFDWMKYNEPGYDDGIFDNNATIVPFRCARPTPDNFVKQSHYSRGVEVEILGKDGDEKSVCDTYTVDKFGKVTSNPNNACYNPDLLNRIGSEENPVRVRPDKLHYRVRFRYYNPRYKNGGTKEEEKINISSQYVLDTPVFDDISIVYMTRPKILLFREVNE